MVTLSFYFLFQRLLQLALLNIGQLDHAMKEQMSWLAKTDRTLDDIVPVYGDPRMVEIELAKLKVSCYFILISDGEL